MIFSYNLYSQILISPYIVYTDEKNKIGNFIVQNESENNYEISISFTFGYPVSDSTGQIVMKYFENDSSQTYSINNYIRAFPKKFILQPKKRQVVRLTIKAPDSLPAGTYWTRIITSAVPYSEQMDTIQSGITARIRFVLNQVTTCLYRVGEAESGVKISNMKILPDSVETQLFIDLERIGNSPFIGNLKIKIKDESGNVVKELSEYIPLYFNLSKRIKIFHNELEKNKKYSIDISVENTEKEDIPESSLKIISLPSETFPLIISN
jgi:P pilus assembly chaperone PapD